MGTDELTSQMQKVATHQNKKGIRLAYNQNHMVYSTIRKECQRRLEKVRLAS